MEARSLFKLSSSSSENKRKACWQLLSKTTKMKVLTLTTNSLISTDKRFVLQKSLESIEPNLALLKETRLGEAVNVKLHVHKYLTFRNDASRGIVIPVESELKANIIRMDSPAQNWLLVVVGLLVNSDCIPRVPMALSNSRVTQTTLSPPRPCVDFRKSQPVSTP